ncbi:TPA: hypothetical protein ACHU4E_000668, partial [Shigella sonnei]
MTYALIDNSTLTAVQRIEGKVKTRSKDSVDTDIIAFENYIQSILFYDHVIAVDDYIPEYRGSRISSFREILFLDKAQYGLDEIESEAKKISDALKPKIRG